MSLSEAREPGAVIIRAGPDKLSEGIRDRLAEEQEAVIEVDSSRLAGVPLTMREGRLWVRGLETRAVLFRTPRLGPFSVDFAESDAVHADAEARAVWLAALNLETVLAINAWDEIAWMGISDWLPWRDRMRRFGIAVAPLRYGGSNVTEEEEWLPFSSCQPRGPPQGSMAGLLGPCVGNFSPTRGTLLVGGQVVRGEPTFEMERTARLLKAYGIRIAEVRTNGDGDVVSIDTLPNIEAPHEVERSVDLILGEILENLHRGQS